MGVFNKEKYLSVMDKIDPCLAKEREECKKQNTKSEKEETVLCIPCSR